MPAAHCYTLQHAANRFNALQHTATYGNALQHTTCCKCPREGLPCPCPRHVLGISIYLAGHGQFHCKGSIALEERNKSDPLCVET